MSSTVSISEALDEAPLGLFHFRAVVTAGVGFFADAYDLFIIGPALVLIEESWHPGSSSVSLLGATSLFAAFFGAVLFGRLADVVGRKRIYGIEAAVMVIGSLASALAPNMGWLLVARFVLGVGIGGDYPVSAVLMAEFANRSDRGRLIGSVFSMQAAGLIAGPVVALTLLGAGVQHDLLWRIMLGVGAVPAAMVIYRRRKMPESPRFVAKVRGQWKQAARDVATFSSGELSVAGLSDVSSKRLSLRAFLTDRRYVKTLIGTAGTWFLVDYAYYGNTISTPRILQIVDHSVSLTSSLAWTLIIFLAAALPGYMLAVQVMDRIGHRLIQVSGFLAMGVTFFAIGAFHSVIVVPGLFLVVYGVSYFFTEFGPNMSTFVLSAELYPVSMRTTGDGISAGVGKLGAFAGVLTFPVLTTMFGLRGTLLVSAGVCAAGAALTLVLPEPARRSLEEVAEEPSGSEQAIAPFVLLRQERANRERAEMLASSASVFAGSLEAEQVLEILTVQARAGLRCEQTVVILIGEDKVASIYTRGISEPQLTEIMGVTEEPVENLNATAIAERPSLVGLVDSSVVAVETVKLRRRGEVVVICANKARRQFNNEERSLLRAIAMQGATALDNALLYQDTQQSEAKYRQLVEQLPPVLYSRRQDTILPTYVSPRIEQLLGISQDEFLADPWSRVHPGDRERVGHLHSNLIEGDIRTMDEYRMIRTGGEVIWVRDEAVLLPGPPAIVQGLLSDITARHKAEVEVEFLAYHDPLTRLANRRMFNEVLERELAKSRRHRLSVGVLFIDVDNFKGVNDSLGHDAGDQLLVTIAQRLASVVRDGDVVARHGGDEFLVLLENLEEEEGAGLENFGSPPLAAAEVAARRIQQVFREPFELGGTTHISSASIGVAVFPLHAENAVMLLKAADAAMYLAKGQGRGRISSFTEDVPISLDGFALRNRLQNALKNNDWVLHYQLIVDLASARAVGVEALLRWNEPGVGLVLPGYFLSIAEEMGMLDQIGEWVFTEACRQTAEWRDQGMVLPVAVNLSPSQLNQPHLAAHLADLARTHGLTSDQVTIEITETETMGMPELSALALAELRSEGFSIAIDDFGTGYSSLIRLQHMPVNMLKIDRSFVELLPHNPKARSMVFAQIELARNLGISCVAEGVETEAQRRFLLDAGCGLAQGYLFSEPVPANEIQGRVISSEVYDRN